MKEVINDFLVQGLTPGLPLDNAAPVGAIPHAHRLVLGVSKGPDINLSPLPRGMFRSGPRLLSFSPKLMVL